VFFDHFEVNSFSKKKSPPVVVEQAELAQPTNPCNVAVDREQSIVFDKKPFKLFLKDQN
jgi:hypothetical protein